MTGPDQPGTATEPIPPDQSGGQAHQRSDAGRPAAEPPAASRRSSFDSRSLAIGAGAGLLVLVVAGIAFGAARLGALGPTNGGQGARPAVGQPYGPGNGTAGRGDQGQGQRRQVGPLRGPVREFRFSGIPGAAAEGHQITITAIAGPNVSLATADGWTRTIAITATTTLTRAGQAITLADLTVGDHVRFQEVRNPDGTYTVSAIEVVVPRVAGRVTATTSDSITIQRADGTAMTVHVGSATTYQVRGLQNATLADISVGMLIVAQGTQNADGSLQALTVDAAAKR